MFTVPCICYRWVLTFTLKNWCLKLGFGVKRLFSYSIFSRRKYLPKQETTGIWNAQAEKEPSQLWNIEKGRKIADYPIVPYNNFTLLSGHYCSVPINKDKVVLIGGHYVEYNIWIGYIYPSYDYVNNHVWEFDFDSGIWTKLNNIPIDQSNFFQNVEYQCSMVFNKQGQKYALS